MAEKRLYVPVRECCVCHRTAATGKRVAGEPNILAIVPYVYGRFSGKGGLRKAPRIQICEECYEQATEEKRGWSPSAWAAGAGKRLWSALRSSLRENYSEMRQQDAA